MIGHILGLDDVSGRWYAFWSGVGGDLALLGIPWAILRRHTCHVRRCWRIGRHPVEGQPWTVCRRHHPDVPTRAPSRADLTGGAS